MNTLHPRLPRALFGALAALGLFASSARALDGGLPPSGNFNLTKWNMTLPVDAAGGFSGTPLVVATSTLSNGYTYSPYFYTSSTDGAMVFKCPYNGATGGTSSHPRSELRETFTNGSANNWLPGGTHKLNATCYISSSTVGVGGVMCIGQIHAAAPNSTVPTIILRYDNTAGDGQIWVSVKNYASGSPSTETRYSFTPVGAGTKTITYELKMVGSGSTVTAYITVNGQTYTKVMTATDPNWASATHYFKAGVYYVTPVSGCTAKCSFTNLVVTHS